VAHARLERQPRSAHTVAGIVGEPVLVLTQFGSVGLESRRGQGARLGAEEEPQQSGVAQLRQRIVPRPRAPLRQGGPSSVSEKSRRRRPPSSRRSASNPAFVSRPGSE
jgi:hypothetical protein